MRNMSFGKMLGLFAGFLLIVAIGAAVFIKMNQKGVSKTLVTTKKYNQREDVASASASAVSFATKEATTASETASQPASSVANNYADKNQPFANLSAINNPGTAQGATSIESRVANLDARVIALENKLLESKVAGTKTSVNRIQNRRTSNERNNAETRVGVKKVTTLQGYKAMAVVGGRAWVAAPGGNEDSLIKGDELPQIRVHSTNVTTGVVMTTSDQRIESH